MTQRFGKIRWGGERLRSLSHMDYENRIPCGAAYARRGEVKEIVLRNNTISGKAAASRPRPYDVDIVIPAFPQKQVEAPMDALIARPEPIVLLQSLEPAPETQVIARDCHLKISPERWNDSDMVGCDCPDRAVPCKYPALYLKGGDCRTELSGKAEMLADLVESIVEGGEKVLVFTQFRKMGDMPVRFIGEQTGQESMFHHDGCGIRECRKMIDRFRQGHSDKVFVLSLRAAGTGLNLAAASHVIHYGLWWNPAVESQATDHACRIGQHKIFG